MPKTITLRLKDDDYELFKDLAEEENRTISNYIETAVKRFIELTYGKDEVETGEIKNNTEFNRNLKSGLAIIKQKKANIVDK